MNFNCGALEARKNIRRQSRICSQRVQDNAFHPGSLCATVELRLGAQIKKRGERKTERTALGTSAFTTHTRRNDQNKSDLCWITRWTRRWHRYDNDDVAACDARRSDTALHHWRSPVGFHPAGSISFAHGQGGRLQSSEAAWSWIDNCRPTLGWRNWRSDFRSVRAAESQPYSGDLDDVDLRCAAVRSYLRSHCGRC